MYRQGSVAPDGSTATAVKNWIAECEAMFTAAGWTQTADTGQFVAANYTVLSGMNAIIGYEIWESTDTLSSTFPIYLRIEYWRCQSSGTPTIVVQVGTGTNGAGTLTGNVSARWGYNTGFTNSTTVYDTLMSWYVAGGSFCMVLWNNDSANNPKLLCVERSHDASGADTDEYVTLVHFNLNGSSTSQNTTSAGMQSIFKWGSGKGVSYPEQSTITTGLTLSATSSIVGNSVQTGNIFPWVGYAGNPLLLLTVFKRVDVPTSGTIPVSMYGTTRQYLMTTQTYLLGNFSGTATNWTLGIRWEA